MSWMSTLIYNSSSSTTYARCLNQTPSQQYTASTVMLWCAVPSQLLYCHRGNLLHTIRSLPRCIHAVLWQCGWRSKPGHFSTCSCISRG